MGVGGSLGVGLRVSPAEAVAKAGLGARRAEDCHLEYISKLFLMGSEKRDGTKIYHRQIC